MKFTLPISRLIPMSNFTSMDKSGIAKISSTNPKDISVAQIPKKEDGSGQLGNLTKLTELSKQGNLASSETAAQCKTRYVTMINHQPSTKFLFNGTVCALNSCWCIVILKNVKRISFLH